MDLACANLQHILSESKSTWHCYCCYVSEKLHFAQIILTLWMPSRLEWRRTDASVIGVSLALQYGGHGRQTCRNCRGSFASCRSGET